MAGQLSGSPSQERTGLLADFLRNFRLAWRLIRDARVPGWTKLLVPGVMLAYLISPVDLFPDVVPLIGQLDDLAVLALAVRLFIEMCPADIVQFHRNALAGIARPQPRAGTDTGEVIDADYRIIE